MIDRVTMFPISNKTDAPQFDNKAGFQLSDEVHIKKLLKRMGISYFLALLIVACLASSAYFFMHNLLGVNESNGTIINISGRQRMLSQRGALFSLQLATAQGSERVKVREKLLDVADLMETSHSGLISGNEEMGLPAHMSENMHSIYFEAPSQLDNQVKEYIQAIHALVKESDIGSISLHSQNLQTILNVAPNRLLKTLNEAVKQYELEGLAELQETMQWETYVWLVTLIVLVLEGVFIFRPITTQVKDTAGILLQEKHFSENVVNTAQALILGIDHQGNIVFFNEYAQNITKWSEKEILGTNFINHFIPRKKQSASIRIFRDMFSTHTDNTFQSPLIIRDKTEINVNWSNTLLLDPVTREPMILIATGTIEDS